MPLSKHKNEICLTAFIATVLITVFFVFSVSSVDELFLDSAYQYFLTQHGIKEILSLVKKDFSPPLYAIILKLFTKIFNDDSLLTMRIMSLIPIVLMSYLSLYPLRRIAGTKTALICGAFVAFSPVNFYFVKEIRPISFGALFVFGAAVYALIFYKERNYKNLLIFTAFVILAMYTHNISMISCIGIYAAVMLFSLYRKDFQLILKFVLSGIAAAIVYFPWLLVVWKQYKLASSTFTEVHRTPIEYIGLLLVGNYRVFIVIVPIIVIGVIALLLKKRSDSEGRKELKGFFSSKEFDIIAIATLMTLATIVSYYLFNTLIFHVLMRRYTYTFISVSFIALSMLLAKIDVKRLTAFCLIALLMDFGVSGVSLHRQAQESQKAEMVSTVQSLANGENELAFLHFSDDSLVVCAYYFPHAKHYVCNKTFTVSDNYDVYSSLNIIRINDPDDIFKQEESCIVVTYEYDNIINDVQKLFINQEKTKVISNGRYKLAHSYEFAQVDTVRQQ